jgi:hypothetical protein
MIGYRTVKCDGCVGNQTWSNLRWAYYPSLFLERLKKTTQEPSVMIVLDRLESGTSE